MHQVIPWHNKRGHNFCYSIHGISQESRLAGLIYYYTPQLWHDGCNNFDIICLGVNVLPLSWQNRQMSGVVHSQCRNIELSAWWRSIFMSTSVKSHLSGGSGPPYSMRFQIVFNLHAWCRGTDALMTKFSIPWPELLSLSSDWRGRHCQQSN